MVLGGAGCRGIRLALLQGLVLPGAAASSCSASGTGFDDTVQVKRDQSHPGLPFTSLRRVLQGHPASCVSPREKVLLRAGVGVASRQRCWVRAGLPAAPSPGRALSPAGACGERARLAGGVAVPGTFSLEAAAFPLTPAQQPCAGPAAAAPLAPTQGSRPAAGRAPGRPGTHAEPGEPRPGGRRVLVLTPSSPSSFPQLATAGQGAGGAAEPEPSLDKMLGSLTQDLQELGISAAPAGVCAACRKPVAGKVSPGRAPAPPCRCPGSRLPCPRRFSRPWAQPGTPSTSPAPAAGRSWAAGPSSSAAGGRTARRTITEPSPRSAPTAPAPSARYSPRPPTPAPAAAATSPHLFLQKVLTALDQTWHPEHFFCAHCGKVFGDDGKSRGQVWGSCPSPGTPAPIAEVVPLSHTPPGFPWAAPGRAPLPPPQPPGGARLNAVPAGFHERGGKPYCRQDFLAMFAPKCQGCERAVTDNYLSALQGVWHPECFVCTVSAAGWRGRGVSASRGRANLPVVSPGVPERF